MMVGIMGAMKEEVNSFLAQMQVVVKETRSGSVYYTGKLEGVDVVVVNCGIGKVNAALTTQILIDRYRCQKIIFTGLAGSGRNDIAVGDYVIADSLVQHDFDLTHFGREKGMVPAVGKFLKADPEINEALEAAIADCGKDRPEFGKCHHGVVASGDIFVADSALSKQITEEFDASAVEMEGAAMAQVCFVNHIPFAVLRTISDNADESATVSFDSVLNKASVEEVQILRKALASLKAANR